MKRTPKLLTALLATALFWGVNAFAEDEDDQYIQEKKPSSSDTKKVEKKEEHAKPDAEKSDQTDKKDAKQAPKKRKYFTDDSPRVDAGIFHVAAMIGGNFFIEPRYNPYPIASGDYFREMGFSLGVAFDYNYAELDENIPLGLRGYLGYRYLLNSVHSVAFDGIARRIWRFSEKASLGIGIGGSAAIWYRFITDLNRATVEEVVFKPAFVIEGGFDFPPFIVDIRFLLNSIVPNESLFGAELYFGFML